MAEMTIALDIVKLTKRAHQKLVDRTKAGVDEATDLGFRVVVRVRMDDALFRVDDAVFFHLRVAKYTKLDLRDVLDVFPHVALCVEISIETTL